MSGWVVSALLTAAVLIVLLVVGSVEAVKILVTMGVWFIVLGAVALAIEMAVQFVGSRLRRG